MLVLLKVTDMLEFTDMLHRTHVLICCEWSMFSGKNMQNELLNVSVIKHWTVCKEKLEKLLDGRIEIGGLIWINMQILPLYRLRVRAGQLYSG